MSSRSLGRALAFVIVVASVTPARADDHPWYRSRRHVTNVVLTLGAAGLYGFGYATVSTLFPPLVSDFFGRGHAGAIVGALFAIAGCTGGIGPWVAGALYDATGGYGTTWIFCAALNVLALALFTLARAPARTSVMAA